MQDKDIMAPAESIQTFHFLNHSPGSKSYYMADHMDIYLKLVNTVEAFSGLRSMGMRFYHV